MKSLDIFTKAYLNVISEDTESSNKRWDLIEIEKMKADRPGFNPVAIIMPFSIGYGFIKNEYKDFIELLKRGISPNDPDKGTKDSSNTEEIRKLIICLDEFREMYNVQFKFSEFSTFYDMKYSLLWFMPRSSEDVDSEDPDFYFEYYNDNCQNPNSDLVKTFNKLIKSEKFRKDAAERMDIEYAGANLFGEFNTIKSNDPTFYKNLEKIILIMEEGDNKTEAICNFIENYNCPIQLKYDIIKKVNWDDYEAVGLSMIKSSIDYLISIKYPGAEKLMEFWDNL